METTSINTLGGAIQGSFDILKEKVIVFIPELLSAVIILFIGWIIAGFLGKVAEKIIKAIKIDQAVEKTNLGEQFRNAGMELSISGFFRGLVKWLFVLVFLLAAVDILGLDDVTGFLSEIIGYIPKVIVATIILSIAFMVGNLVHRIVRSSTKAAGVMSASLLAVIAKWSIVIFGLLAALSEMEIAKTMINTIFMGIIATLSLAAGLAFGLGGKDEAAQVLRKIREEISHR